MSDENRVLNTFEKIEPLYQKTEIEKTENGILITVGAKLYRAFPTVIAPPVYIVDTKDIIHSKKSMLPLMDMNIQQLDAVFEKHEQDFIVKKLQGDPRIETWDDLGMHTFGTDYQFNDATLGKWYNIESGQVTEDWSKLLADILEYNCMRDPALVMANKSSLARGYVMRYQPHALQITPPNTGKSTFFELTGRLVDKATKNTLLGSAKWTDDKAYGLFHEQYYALAIDQIESQTIENMAGFLLGFLESGRATVAGGGAIMLVTGACPFVVTANPLALQGDHISVMRDILGFLCRNSYAMGRRFGILAYNDYSPLVDNGYDDVEHRKLVATYRALEERITLTLQQFWKHPKVKDFCNLSVYEPSIFTELERCNVIEVASFLRAHVAHSFPHIRGGALNCALVDKLPKLAALEVLAIGDFNSLVDEVIEDAKPYVESLRQINLDSIRYTLS